MGEGEQLVGLSDSFFPLLHDLSHSYLTLLAPTRRPSPRLFFCCCEIRKQDLTCNEMRTYCKQTMRCVASLEREGRSRISSNLPEIAEPGQFVTWCLALWSSCCYALLSWGFPCCFCRNPCFHHVLSHSGVPSPRRSSRNPSAEQWCWMLLYLGSGLEVGLLDPPGHMAWSWKQAFSKCSIVLVNRGEL